MASINQNYYQYTSQVTLASGQNNDSGHVDVTGAKAVSFTVSCNVNHQLSTATPQVKTTDGKQTTVTTGALPAGTSTSAINLNAAGVITTADLSSATARLLILRPALDPSFGSDSAPRMYGISEAWVTLTKAVTAGNAIYTIVTTVYY